MYNINQYNWDKCPIQPIVSEDVAFVNDYIGHELFDSYEELEAAVIDALCK